MFDGPDGVGKTTQVALAAKTLRSDGYRVQTTRVSGGTPIGEALRDVSLSALDRPVMTDLYIILAQNHALSEQIKSWREAGDVILVDRGPLSIIAYEVYGGGLDKKRGIAAADEAVALFSPDLMVLYSAPYEVLRKRTKHLSTKKADYFESKPASYFANVAKGYKAAAGRYPVSVIDASGSIAAVNKKTMTLIYGLTDLE